MKTPSENRNVQVRRTTMTGGTLVAMSVLNMMVATTTHAQEACRQGYVWREAFSGDFVCVSPATRSQTAQDNSQAGARREPGGGAYGPNTCRQGYVWREARADDFVCVTPATRAQAAADNREAVSRRASAAPPAASAPQPDRRTSEWSKWGRAAGVEYRYRWSLNNKDTRQPPNLEAMFQVKNTQAKTWIGAVRSLDCKQNILSRSTSVELKPNETKEVKLITPNCGTREKPYLRPDIAQSVRID